MGWVSDVYYDIILVVYKAFYPVGEVFLILSSHCRGNKTDRSKAKYMELQKTLN